MEGIVSTPTATPLQPDAAKIRTLRRASEIDQRLMESRRRSERLFLTFRRAFLPYYFIGPPPSRVKLRVAWPRERMRPSFACVGAVRSGTTLLGDYLMQHPCVALPLSKEVGMAFPTQRRMLAHFPTRREQRKIDAEYGAGSAVTGFCAPVVPSLSFPYLAAALASDMRFVLILRDPVERTFAHWRWDQVLLAQVRRDPLWQRFPDFEECMRLELESMHSHGAGMPTVSGVKAGGYIRHSIYLPFLKKLFDCFGRDRVLVVDAQEFFDDPPGIARQAYRFLGLPDYEPVEMPVQNAGPPGAMPEATRQALEEFFRPRNQELYGFLGRDLGW